jgi:hypothetical protein
MATYPGVYGETGRTDVGVKIELVGGPRDGEVVEMAELYGAYTCSPTLPPGTGGPSPLVIYYRGAVRTAAGNHAYFYDYGKAGNDA